MSRRQEDWLLSLKSSSDPLEAPGTPPSEGSTEEQDSFGDGGSIEEEAIEYEESIEEEEEEETSSSPTPSPSPISMALEAYRKTTLGNCLQESLDDFIRDNQISPELAMTVLKKYDQVMNNALEKRVRSRIKFHGKLDTYRFCDSVWTFTLKNVEFRENPNIMFEVDQVKVVACDGKSNNGVLGKSKPKKGGRRGRKKVESQSQSQDFNEDVDMGQPMQCGP